ncbi:hypothetical protein [Streptomyces lushanensis]|uniref:hypothetical protein n=1 Tax=Streptomyces lushanensis TaxID=1434255 RepID=UPI0008330D15|nr:hypothetical protein [Streptomyces lushanensis]
MAESVWVSCPSCGGRHAFAVSEYPCACGAPVAPVLVGGAPVEPVGYRSWAEEWVAVRCSACGREGQWPRPELDCPCGTVLRIPVREDGGTGSAAAEPAVTEAGPPAPPGEPRPAEPPSRAPLPHDAVSPRPSFRPLTIRTAHDAVTAASLYLRWLGFEGVVRAGEGTEGAPYLIDLCGPDVVAQVEPTTRPVNVRSVECLWLNGLGASARGVFFSLAGYADDALARADALGIPLFVMDLTGTPRPVNGAADELVSTGA